MSDVTQTKLRDAIEFMKQDSGKGTKSRKQQKFRDVYSENAVHIIAGERYDDAGIGPATAKSAVTDVFEDVPPASTLTESVAAIDTSGENSLSALVSDLDEIAMLSGDEQEEYLKLTLKRHSEPSLITLALLGDESFSLGTSQMREAFFDGTRDERKHTEAFVETTAEFISLAQDNALPDGPTVGEPFSPMLAVPESRGEPSMPVAQLKVDGYRILLHISDGEATAYTRAKNDVTESLPELSEIEFPAGEYILDAEVIADNGSYSATSSRIGRDEENVERDVEMNFALFDAIVYAGEQVWREPYAKRYTRLESFDVNTDSRVYLLGIEDDIEQAKNEVIENGDEGLIVKDWQAEYEFGKRSEHWQKVKVDSDTLDLVVDGFVEGEGKFSGTLGKVTLKTSDDVYVGDSGSGFTEETRDKIWNNQDMYYGEVFEIEARGIGTQNKLRMPIFKEHRTEGSADSWEKVTDVMDSV